MSHNCGLCKNSLGLIYIHSSLTYHSHAICVGTLGADDSPETFLLQGTVRLVDMRLTITVHHAPLTVQNAKAITDTGQKQYK